MSIGTNIYMLRKSKKITQGELAEKLGVSEQAVSKWENDVCAPDVSLFPIMADYFGVSIDRLFGFHLNSYEAEVKEIIKAADDSHDTYKEIEIISAGLERYPNSPDLKIYLAFSLSMVNRMSKDEKERKNAVKKAVKLCTEVVDTCGDTKKIDSALNMLVRIHNETGEYEKTEKCIEKLSAEAYSSRITGTAHMLAYKKNLKELAQYAEHELWKMYWTMDHIFQCFAYEDKKTSNYERALNFLEAREKLLSVFDKGCPNFYATYKIYTCAEKAEIYKKLGNKEKCIAELERFAELAKQVQDVAKSEDFTLKARNPMYFSELCGDESEEYMTGIFPEKILKSFESFLGGDEKFEALKNIKENN